MKGGVMLNSQRVYALLDLKATYSFVSYKVVNKLNILIGKLSRGSAFSTLDLKATYSFVSYKVVNKLNILIGKLSRGSAFSTLLKENIDADDVYEGCIVLIKDHALKVNLILLRIYNY